MIHHTVHRCSCDVVGFILLALLQGVEVAASEHGGAAPSVTLRVVTHVPATPLSALEPVFGAAPPFQREAWQAGGYTRPLFTSTEAVLVTPPRVPLSNRLGGNHAPNVSHNTCLR